MKKKYIIIIATILILGVAALAFYGFVPVMKINGEVISHSRFLKVYTAFRAYDVMNAKGVIDDKEIKRRALTDIVESRILDLIVQKTNADFRKLAEENTEKAIAATKGLSLNEAAERLYGISAVDFKKLVLVPQAQKELLVKHYEYNPEELNALWNGAVHKIDVKIYYPGYEWKNGEVKIK